MNFYYVYIIKDILKMSTFNVKESSHIKTNHVIFLLFKEYKVALLKTLNINIQLLCAVLLDASFNETIQSSLEV